jgi:rsbT co-antagonist protein RsbR
LPLGDNVIDPTYTNLLAGRLGDILEQLPIPISIYDQDGLQVASNAATAALWNIRREQWVGHFNMVTDPQLAAQGSAERHRRVMQGETIVLPPSRFSGRQTGLQADAREHRWVGATYLPLRDASGTVTHLMAILRDVTEQIEQEQEIEKARSEIAAQRATIASLSTPVVKVWEAILAMPLVGVIDSHRAMQVTESLLSTIANQQAECVIIDITGVPLVDTQVAQYLIQTAQACKLLGCEAALVGTGVELAQTIVQLGVDLRALNTMADLQAGIAWAFKRRGIQVVQRS